MQGFVHLMESVGTRFTRFLVRQHGVPVLLAGTIGLAGLGAMLTSQPVQGASNSSTVVQPMACHVEAWYGWHRHHHHGNDGDADDVAGCATGNGTVAADPYWHGYGDSSGNGGYVGDGADRYGSGDLYSNSPADGYGYVGGSNATDGNSYIQGYTTLKGYGNPNGLGQ
jgi:hypothetical protein